MTTSATVTVSSNSIWHSLRFRLPFLVSTLVVIVLTTFLWTVNQALDQTLIRAAGERAQSASDQVAALMAQGAERSLNAVKRVAAEPAVQRYLLQPAGDSAEVRQLLSALAAPAQPPVELWSDAGVRLLEVASPAAQGHMAVAAAASPPQHPGFDGVSPRT